MSEIMQAIVLGAVQGATEFLPISSSGHLVIIPWLFGWPHHSLLFDTVLHWGTLLSIILVFWRDLVRIFVASVQSLAHRSLQDPNARLGWYIIAGTIPAALAGLLFKDYFESLFSNALAAGFFLLVTAALLAGSEQFARRIQTTQELDRLSLSQALFIGCAQALALAPGLSRSGSTIAAGLTTGLRRDAAARFSFLLGTPAFLGAGLIQLAATISEDGSQVVNQIPVLLAGFLVSTAIGFVAIRLLLSYLRSHSLYIFAVYCAIVGTAVIVLSFVRG